MAQGNLTPLGFGAQGFDPFSVLRREMEQLFDGASRGGAIQAPTAATVVPPRIDISEDDREIKISAEMPGMRPEDVTVTVNDDVLTIRGEREQERETTRKNYHLVERSLGVFQRSVRLPFAVDPAQVQARVNHGVLSITIPKNDPKRGSQRIDVRSGGDGAEGSASKDGSSDASKEGSGGAAKEGSGGAEKEGSGSGEQAHH
jgi:HSP20 family protein